MKGPLTVTLGSRRDCASRPPPPAPGTRRPPAAFFFDRAHQPIHELASATANIDRAASAKLLEAKQVVETDLDHPGAAGLADHLVALAAATAAAASLSGDHIRPAACEAS